MTEPNIPALRKYVEWVEEQAALPEIDRTWHQRYWHTPPHTRVEELTKSARLEGKINFSNMWQLEVQCGTAYCLAGKVAADADERYLTQEWVGEVHLATKACEVLGLKDDGGSLHHRIFAASNTATRIRAIAEEEAGEKL